MNPPAVPHPGALVSKKKKSFIGMPAPAGYVAGVGRGATGFTTRSDIGPARDSSDVPDDRHMPPKKLAKKREEEEEEEDLNDNNYDEFAGYGGSLFNKDPYDKDDEEADKIYESIERRMDERGKALRESKTKRELEKYRQERPKIQQQFSDLKPDLSQVSEEEWLNIPDVGDARNRKQRNPRPDLLTPVPDSLLAKKVAIASGDQVYAIDPVTSSPIASSSALDMRRVGEARNTFMGIRLNQVSDSVSGQTVCDPKGYLTGLQTTIPSYVTDPSQIKNGQKLLEAVRKANPTHAPAWVFSARFEEGAGRLKTAKALIMEGCRLCPQSASVWLEAARLYPRDEARKIIVEALQKLPECVDLWIRAAELETSLEAKRSVYRNATQRIPHSVMLWQKTVDLEDDPDEAKKLLRGAVECCPTSVDLWNALSKLEDYEGAKDVLRRAREKNPTDRQLWITGAKLQEANAYSHMVEKLIRRSITDLSHRGVDINRVEWIKDAVEAEKAGFKQTCHAIIKNIIGVGIEDEDRLAAWIHDAESFIASGSFECARAVFEKIVETYPDLEAAWLPYVKFEEQQQAEDKLSAVLSRAVEKCLRSETLWLRFADLDWTRNVDLTRERLSCAFAANPNSERIWLAAAKLESENGFHDRARALLAKARREALTPDIILHSAKFEREHGQLDEAFKLLSEGKSKYRNCPDFYLMLGQISEQSNNPDEARKHYKDGLLINPTSESLWISLAQLESRYLSFNQARSTLSTARTKNPKSAKIWLESVRLERRAGMRSEAERLLTKAIRDHRDCSDIALLLAEEEANRSNRRG
ncbi:Pre-mRNA-processing factor 6, partial [Fragariocoptes setiger]